MEAEGMEEQRDRASVSEGGKSGFPAEQEAGVGYHSSTQVSVCWEQHLGWQLCPFAVNSHRQSLA